MNMNKAYSQSTILTNAYEPFIVNNKQAGEVHWLTQKNSSGQPAYSGLWRCEPMRFEYTFPGDETFHVLQGNLTIALPDGTEVTLREGDIASFNKGVKSVWTVQSSFKKFFVISNC